MAYKDGDANVRSVWLCSRNDAIGNVAVVLAAGAVAFFHNGIPDLDRRRRHGGAVPHVVGADPPPIWGEWRHAGAHGHHDHD